MTENISAESTKKRGRPPVISDRYRAAIRRYHPGRAARTINDIAHRDRAVNLLVHDPKFTWLVDLQSGRGKRSILSELGRFDDDDTLRELAAVICQEKPKTREAVARLRRFRLGQEAKAGNRLALFKHLDIALYEYLSRYPQTSNDDILNALRCLIFCHKPEEEEEEET